MRSRESYLRGYRTHLMCMGCWTEPCQQTCFNSYLMNCRYINNHSICGKYIKNPSVLNNVVPSTWTNSGRTAHTPLYPPVQLVPPYSLPPFFLLSQTELPAKVSTCARDRHALQQLALNVHIKHSDLNNVVGSQ